MLAEVGKILIFSGLILVALGLIITMAPALRVGRLPGDIHIQRENWNVYIPITTSILLSIVLTVLLWVITFFRR